MTRDYQHLSTAQKRKRRVRAKLYGTPERPRLTVFRSNKHLYLQVIDDAAGKTLAAANDVVDRKSLKKKESMTKTEAAQKIAERLAAELKKQKITQLVFDRGQYRHHGRLKAVTETLREAGIAV